MAKNATKEDLREGLPGHGDEGVRYGNDIIDRTQDARVARDPQIVTPEPGKNVLSGQTTKG